MSATSRATRSASRLAVATILAVAVAAPAEAAPTIVSTPNPGSSNTLGGLVAFPTNDVWGVGSASAPSYSGCHGRTLTIESTGGAFAERAETPAPTPICASVNGVSGRSPIDIWAVGSTNSARDPHARHWNGTAWTAGGGATIPLPPSGGRRLRTTGLNAVAAVAGSPYTWAVGKAEFADFSRHALVERFDGSSWKLFGGPESTGSVLNGISAAGPRDVWAVGSTGGTSGQVTLAARWTGGRAFDPVPTPNANANNSLKAVAAIAPDDVWAVGSSIKSAFDGISQYRTLVEHWDGASWTIVPSPNHGSGSNELTGVAALGRGNVYAVGYRLETVAGIPVAKTLVLHLTGGRWLEVPSPNAGSGDNLLAGAVASGLDNVWAWGNSADGTLVLHVAP